MKHRTFGAKLLYPAKLPVIIKGEVKTFISTLKTDREFMISKLSLLKTLEIFRLKKKGR